MIIVCGINHKTAPLSLRERTVFSLEKLPLYLADFLAHENSREVVIVSTCNRSEIYCEADDVAPVVEWFCKQHQLTQEDLATAIYTHIDTQAIKHIMQVACGLDSMILGESQILGQIKTAYSESCAVGAVGSIFNRLFQQVFSVAKEVRTNTLVGACPVSVASATVGLAKQVYPQLSQASVVVIGAGATIDLLLRHLKSYSIQVLKVANRNIQNAELLTTCHGGEAIALADLPNALIHADIVISATGSPLPLITKQMMQDALPQRNKSLNIIDIAVPRDVEESVADLENVQVYCIDDLKLIIQHNVRGREHAAEKAREVIQKKSQEVFSSIKSLEVVGTTITAYRRQIENIGQLELAKAARQLRRGDDPLAVLESFAYAFTNKLLHTPSVQLRQAGFEGRFDILQLAQELFAIPQPQSELL